MEEPAEPTKKFRHRRRPIDPSADMSSFQRAPITLYKSLLRQGKKMEDYNFRSYAIRRIKDEFQKGRSLTGQEAEAAIKHGENQLQMLTRQSTISQLFPSARSVMENPV